MIEKYAHTHHFDWLAIQETGSNNEEKLKLTNMSLITDSNQAKNRGASLHVRSSNMCTKITEIAEISKNVDSSWGLTVIRNKRYIVGSVYVKLNCPTAISDTVNMLVSAQNMTKKFRACGVILSGDLNARHPLWGDTVSNLYGNQLTNLLDSSKFSIIKPNTPTFLCNNGSSVIDLTIVSNNLARKVETCITDDEVELFSGAPLRGHVPVITEILVNRTTNNQATITEKLDINNIKWALWTDDLEQKLEADNAVIESYDEPVELWKYVEKTIKEVTTKHGQMKKSTVHSKPYWTNNLTLLCENMREARKAYNKRNTDTNEQNMIRTKEEFDAARKAECEKFIMDKTKNLNATEAKKFWKEFNKIFMKKSEGGIDPLDNGNGGFMTGSDEIEEKMFSTFFQCRHMTDANFDDTFYDSVNRLYDEIKTEAEVDGQDAPTVINTSITIQEIKNAIKKTDANKSSLDNHDMHPKMLHQFGDNSIRTIQRLFNLCLNKGKWVWNDADVIFLKKDGKDTYSKPGSYRPISITSYIGKLLEKILAARIVSFLIRNNFHDPKQEGFTKGRNTVRYLNRLNLGIKTDLLDNKTVIALFVDMEKAFDSVWKRGLIVKLAKLNIKGKVLQLIDNFLTTRTVNLNVNGSKGEQRDCGEYGLPQGSALAPILFKVFLLDLFEDLGDSDDIETYKFADDGTIKVSAKTTEKCNQALCRVTDSLENWTQRWRMIINCNPNKTEYICFGTAERDAIIPDSIKLGDKTVKRVQQTKVLGLIIDEKLSYIPHGKEVNRKLLGKWAKICKYCNIHWGFNQRVMSQLINTFFVSSLQYAGHIWINKKSMEEVNKIWYKLIKSSVGATFNIKLSIGEVILGVTPISIQTTINQVKHLLKLQINDSPEDSLKEYVRNCVESKISQPAELKTAMKEVYKFLRFKLTRHPNDFTEEDADIISNQDIRHYCDLSHKSCSYTKNCIRKYTEVIWQEKLRNQSLVEGEGHIPRPSCSRLPVPLTTTREEEVILMSLMYPQNLMNSFLYRHTHSVESPLCQKCGREEETPYHVIWECSDHPEEMQQLMSGIIGDEVLQADCITLLNCSRQKRFIELCLEVLSQGQFRHHINLNDENQLRDTVY